VLRALIVDDDRDMRFLVRMTIEVANHGLAVAGEANSGTEAIAAVQVDRPEVIVLDNRMPGMTGLETARHILSEHPEQSIILFSAYLDADTIAEARELGIHACMDKTDVDRLPEALWQLAAGA
jgi:two-component system nitrogen regulation response regulator GlnG